MLNCFWLFSAFSLTPPYFFSIGNYLKCTPIKRILASDQEIKEELDTIRFPLKFPKEHSIKGGAQKGKLGNHACNGAPSEIETQAKAFPYKLFQFEYPLTEQIELFPIVKTYAFWEYNPIEDLCKTILIMKKEFKILFDEDALDDLNLLMEDELEAENYPDLIDHAYLQYTMKRLRRICKNLQSRFTLKTFMGVSQRPSDELVFHVLEQSYLRVINSSEAKSLNSKDVRSRDYIYGELRPCLIASMLERAGRATLEAQENALFIDFGSGIGNVCLQVSGMTGCRSIGVEILTLPFEISLDLKNEFIARLSDFYGFQDWSEKLLDRIHLFHGDFLRHEAILESIIEADVVLVNNLTFSEALNFELKQLFSNMKLGAKIISLASFASVKRGRSPRTMIGQESHVSHRKEGFLSVEKIEFPQDSVSWTYAGGHYYLHTVVVHPQDS